MTLIQNRKVNLAIVFSLILTLVTLSINTPALASGLEKTPEQNPSMETVTLTEEEKDSIKELESTGVDAELMIKLLEVSNYISFNNDQETLNVSLSDDSLRNEHGFTETQLQDFKAILDGTYQSEVEQVTAGESDQVVAASSGYRAGYLSNFALKSGTFAALGAAAQVSPAALMAAWTGVSSLLAGPLGTVAGISTAVLGGAFFADLALKITGAITQGKGVAFYLDWGIPPVKTAIE